MTTSTKTTFAFSKATIGAVKSAFGKAAKIELAAHSARNAAGQRLVDELLMLCDTVDREAFFKRIKAIAACKEIFSKCAGLSESSINNYPTSVKIAFVHDVPFSASLFTADGKRAAGIDVPERSDNGKKAGKVSETTQAALYKTLSKAIAQARMLKRDEAAAELLDFCLETFDGFKEEATEEATI